MSMRKALLIAAIILFLLPNVFAIGLRSNSLHVNIDFKLGFEDTYYYSPVYRGSDPIDLEVYVENDKEDGTVTDMKPYFKLSDNIIKNIYAGYEPYFSVTVRFPTKIEEPGTHKVHVGVRELLPESGGIGVRTAIEALFFIEVPFEGKYLRYILSAESVNQGTPLRPSLYLENRGTEAIQMLFADIQLVDNDNITLNKKRTSVISLGSQEKKTLKVEIPTTNVQPGEYTIRADIYQDDNNSSTETKVKIGELDFEIINQTTYMVTGKLNEMFIETENKWANPVENVFAEISIGNYAAIKTTSENFNGFETKKLRAYFDASGIIPGVYPMTSTVHFEGKTKSKTTQIEIVRESFLKNAFANVSLAGTLMLIILLIVIIINISLFFILAKKKNDHENNR
jgi:hypothetical protein